MEINEEKEITNRSEQDEMKSHKRDNERNDIAGRLDDYISNRERKDKPEETRNDDKMFEVYNCLIPDAEKCWEY